MLGLARRQPALDRRLMSSADVNVPTGGLGELIAFIISPKVLGVAAGCLFVAWVVRRLWEAIPKGLLVIVLLFALAVSGALVLKGVNR
jgi:hypothetical protein